MLAVKEPVNLMRNDHDRPDGTTLQCRGPEENPWRADVTVPDTYAESHIGSTAIKQDAAANDTAQNKYAKMAGTYILYPFTVESVGLCLVHRVTVTNHFARWSSCEVRLSVCLSVCLSARISPEPHARSLRIFCTCCLCPWLGPPPAC